MKIKAYGKINLALDVVSEREDGYHDLEMIMAPIALHDLVMVDVIDSGIEITSNNRIVPTDSRNIAYKVAALLIERFHIRKGVRIQIYKHIPMQAGLAGGSADGAAVLRGMNEIFHLNLTLEELADIGAEVGSDIPFCIFNEMAYVTGVGDHLDFFEYESDYSILLVKPRRGVPTKYAYQNVDLEKCDHPSCQAMIDAMHHQDHAAVIRNLGNSLEQPAFELVPEIKEIKEKMIALGFEGAMMTGSGSCVFGLTKDPLVLDKGYNHFKSCQPFVLRTRFKSINDQ